MKWRYLPNLITLTRLCLLPWFLVLLLYQHFETAFYAFFLAGFSDGLDGWLARQYHWQSQLGAMLDPICDKLFITTSYLMLGYLQLVPKLLVVVVICRDAIIVNGVNLCRYLIGHVAYRATYLSKWNTVLQGGVIFLAIYQQAFAHLPRWCLPLLFAVTTVTSVISGSQYVTMGYRLIKQHQHATYAGH